MNSDDLTAGDGGTDFTVTESCIACTLFLNSHGLGLGLVIVFASIKVIPAAAV